MANTYKTLGQLLPSAGTLTTLYTVPAATTTFAQALFITNQSSTTPTSFRVSIAVAGAADTTKQYIYFDFPINANDTFQVDIGITLNATDVVRCLATAATLSFNLFGLEIT